jgi:hypothetical protein
MENAGRSFPTPSNGKAQPPYFLKSPICHLKSSAAWWAFFVVNLPVRRLLRHLVRRSLAKEEASGDGVRPQRAQSTIPIWKTTPKTSCLVVALAKAERSQIEQKHDPN